MIELNRMENGSQPATKQDIAEVRSEVAAVRSEVAAVRSEVAAVRSEVAAVRIDLTTEMRAMEDRLIEAFRDSQTELLKAFYSFTESNRQRVTQLEGNQASLITRVGTLEDRITNLERKFLTPPTTQ